MGVGRGGAERGLFLLHFKIFSKKGLFSCFSVGKNKFYYFWRPLEKYWENPLVPPLEEILLTPMSATSFEYKNDFIK